MAGIEPENGAERRVVEAALAGELADLPAVGLSDQPVRAALVADLALGLDPARRVRLEGVRISGATITGPLDLEGARRPEMDGAIAAAPLHFRDCTFDHPIDLSRAHLAVFEAVGSTIPGFKAVEAKIAGPLDLSRSRFPATSAAEESAPDDRASHGGEGAPGPVPTVDGDASAGEPAIEEPSSATGLDRREAPASTGVGGEASGHERRTVIDLDGLSTQGSVRLAEIAAIGRGLLTVSAVTVGIGGSLHLEGAGDADGPLRLILGNLRVQGHLSAIGATLDQLNVDQCEIGGSAFFNRVTAYGPLGFAVARIEGATIFSGAILHGRGGLALNFDSSRLGSFLFLCGDGDEPFRAKGCIRLWVCEINGNAVVRNARLAAVASRAIALDIRHCRILGSLQMDAGEADGLPTEIDGAVVLTGTRIEGDLECRGNRLDGLVLARGIEVRGDVLFSRTEATDTINLRDSGIGGNLDFRGAWLRTERESLEFPLCRIGGSVFMSSMGDRCFEADGGVLFSDSKIGAVLSLNGASLGETSGQSLYCERAEIGGGIFLRPVGDAPFRCEGSVSFSGTSVKGPFSAQGAQISGCIDLSGARISFRVEFRGAHLKGTGVSLAMSNTIVGNDVDLFSIAGHRFVSDGTILLRSSQIDGDLDLRGARITSRGNSLEAPLCRIGGAVNMTPSGDKRFEAEGDINFAESRIAATLVMSAARIGGRLRAHGVSIGTHVFMRDSDGGVHAVGERFECKGLVDFASATIGGYLQAYGARLAGGSVDRQSADGPALRLAHARIGADLSLCAGDRYPFQCDGLLTLTGLRVEGNVDLRGGWFRCAAALAGGADPDDRGNGEGNGNGEDHQGQGMRHTAIDLAQARIGGELIIGPRRPRGEPDKSEATAPAVVADCPALVVGCLTLDGAHIGSRFSQIGTIFRRPAAARDEPVRIDGDAVRRDKAGVCLSMIHTKVDGAFETERLGVDSSVMFLLVPYLEGERLDDARTRNLVDLVNEQGPLQPPRALDYRLRPDGLFDLRSASVRNLRDHPLTGWPAPEGLMALNDFSYDFIRVLDSDQHSPARRRRTLSSVPSGLVGLPDGERIRASAEVRGDPYADPWQRRRAWLRHQYRGDRPQRHDFRPQPYEQLARALRGQGYSYDADKIASAKRALRRACGADRVLDGVLGWVVEVTSDYGYSSPRALLSLVLWLIVGIVLTEMALAFGEIADLAHSDADAVCRWQGLLAPIDGCTGFSALVFAFDLFTPVVDTGATDGFGLRAAAAWPWKMAFMIYELISVIVVSIAVVTFTGLLRRD